MLDNTAIVLLLQHGDRFTFVQREIDEVYFVFSVMVVTRTSQGASGGCGSGATDARSNRTRTPTSLKPSFP